MPAANSAFHLAQEALAQQNDYLLIRHVAGPPLAFQLVYWPSNKECLLLRREFSIRGGKGSNQYGNALRNSTAISCCYC